MARRAGHHTVPQFYLKRFGEPPNRQESRLVAWDKTTLASLPAQGVGNLAKIRDFYAIPGQEGDDAQALERLIADYETAWSAAMEELDHGLPVDDGVRHAVSQFVSFQFCRTTRSRNLITKTESDLIKFIGKMTFAAYRAKGGPELARAVFRSQTDSWDSSDDETDQCIRDIEQGEFEISVGNNTHLQQLLGVLEHDSDYIRYVFQRVWRVLRSSDARFVTSDHPVVLVENRMPTAGLATAQQIVLPLSPNTCLTMDFGRTGHSRSRRATSTEVRAINARTIAAADRWVYSHPATRNEDVRVGETGAHAFEIWRRSRLALR